MAVLAKPEIKATLFDFGRTIHDFYLDTFFNWPSRKFGISRHYFWEMFSRTPDGLLYPYECGQDPKEFFEGFVRESKKLVESLKSEEGKLIIYPEFTEKEFFDALDNIFDPSPPKRDRLDLLRKLKGKGYGVYVLSNINKRHVAYLKGGPEYGYRFSRFREVFEIVDRFIASCDDDIQCRKTKGSYEIFIKALAISGTRPEETVFVDDMQRYVEAFQDIGGHGIVCSGNWTRVEAELYALGVRWE